MYHVSAQGVDERMISIHYYYTIQRRRTVKGCQEERKTMPSAQLRLFIQFSSLIPSSTRRQQHSSYNYVPFVLGEPDVDVRDGDFPGADRRRQHSALCHLRAGHWTCHLLLRSSGR